MAKEVTPCQSCPFRINNWGKRVPKGVYREANLRRLWTGLSAGERLACAERVAPAAPPRDCSGALLLVTRHLHALRNQTFESYQRVSPTPLTQQGVSRWVNRLAFGAEGVALADDAVTPEPTPARTEVGVPWNCSVTNGNTGVSTEFPSEVAPEK